MKLHKAPHHHVYKILYVFFKWVVMKIRKCCAVILLTNFLGSFSEKKIFFFSFVAICTQLFSHHIYLLILCMHPIVASCFYEKKCNIDCKCLKVWFPILRCQVTAFRWSRVAIPGLQQKLQSHIKSQGPDHLLPITPYIILQYVSYNEN